MDKIPSGNPAVALAAQRAEDYRESPLAHIPAAVLLAECERRGWKVVQPERRYNPRSGLLRCGCPECLKLRTPMAYHRALRRHPKRAVPLSD